MTYNQFLKELKKLKDKKWVLPISGRIRFTKLIYHIHIPLCPITAVCEARTQIVFLPRNFVPAAMSINLPVEIAKEIVAAADDNATTEREEKIRRDLLKATGLNKKS